MNLDRALILLLASVSAVSGFAPGYASSRTSRLVTGSTLFSEEATASAEDAQAPEFDRQIYLGNISFDTVESELRAAFGKHGTVAKVSMPLDRETMKSRGFAFVTMSNAEEHAAAIAAINESDIGGRTVYASESLPKEKVAESKKKYQAKKESKTSTIFYLLCGFCHLQNHLTNCSLMFMSFNFLFLSYHVGNDGTKIYVGNLNFATTQESLQSAFAAFGEVKDCFLPLDYDGNPRGFAFISMAEDDAVKAIEGLNGSDLDGRVLTVNKSLPKGQKAAPKRKF